MYTFIVALIQCTEWNDKTLISYLMLQVVVTIDLLCSNYAQNEFAIRLHNTGIAIFWDKNPS